MCAKDMTMLIEVIICSLSWGGGESEFQKYYLHFQCPRPKCRLAYAGKNQSCLYYTTFKCLAIFVGLLLF